MTSSATPTALAENASNLGENLQVHMHRLARVIRPEADVLDRKFLAGLRKVHPDARIVEALSQITPGAASRVMKAKTSPLVFFEQVAGAGGRLAKMNVTPQALVQALQTYDLLLVTNLRKRL